MAWLAAAQKRQQEQRLAEEEEMLGYAEDDIMHDWEFKIVRSVTGAFSNRRTFEQVVAEENEAGWELLEKLDDKRVRFKRHTSARRKDHLLPAAIDPYRTSYGMSEGMLGLLVVGGIFGALIVLLTIFAIAGVL